MPTNIFENNSAFTCVVVRDHSLYIGYRGPPEGATP